MATKPPPKKPPTLAQQASVLVDTGIAPQRAAIQSAIDAAKADQIAMARATQGIVTALGALSAGDAAAVRDTYAGAADRMSGLGNSLTGAVRAAFEREQAGAGNLIRTLGAPGTVGDQGGAGALNAAALGSIAGPAQGLAKEAAASFANVGTNRYATGLRLADQEDLAVFKSQADVKGLRDKIFELEAKRPGMLLEATQQLRGLANQERATQVQIGTLQLQTAKTKQDQAVAMTNLTGTLHIVKGGKVVDTGRTAGGSTAQVQATKAEIARENTKAANARAAAGRAAAASRSREVQSAIDARHQKGIDAKKEAAALTKANKPIPISTKNTIIDGANATGTKILDGYVSKVWSNVPGSADFDRKRDKESDDDFLKRRAAVQAAYAKRLSSNYGTAMAQVMNAIAAQLKLIKYTKAQIRTVAAQIVQTQIAPKANPSRATGA